MQASPHALLVLQNLQQPSSPELPLLFHSHVLPEPAVSSASTLSLTSKAYFPA